MNYLLDTHAFLWYFEDSEKLSEIAASIIEDTNARKYVSIASLWEFSIKYGMGKLRFDGGIASLWKMIVQNSYTILPIKQSYLIGVINLPFIHRDPFDRLLVATAQADGLAILTADENIHKYNVPSVW